MVITPSVYSQTDVQILTNGNDYILTNESAFYGDKFTTTYFTDMTVFKDENLDIYGELAEYYNLKHFSITGQVNADINSYTTNFTPVFLGGLSKTVNVKGFSLTLDALYRYGCDENNKHGYQTTLLWLKDWKYFQFSGNFDFWNSKYYLTEPQLWFKPCKFIYIGCEVRSTNICDDYISAAIKWVL